MIAKLTKTVILALLVYSLPSDLTAATSDRDESITFDLDQYDHLILNGSFEVFLYQDGKEEITLEGPQDVIEQINVDQTARRVKVGNEDVNNKWFKKVKVYVHIDNIRRLEINGISKLLCETPLVSSSLDLECNGIRDVTFEFDVRTLNAEFAGIGNTYLYGKAIEATISYTGLGSLYAAELYTDDLNFESTGIGRAEVFASESLSIEATGIGSVFYGGEPKKTSINRSGIGSVKVL